MTARINREMFSNASQTPEPENAAAPSSASMPPMLAALVSSVPPFSTRRSSPPRPAAASSTQPASVPPASASPANDVVSAPAHKPLIDRTMRIGSIRVAITGSIREAKSFSVDRLEKGQSAPPGTMEAMLVLTGEIDGSLEIETHLRVADGSEAKP
jgi:hypothetical protein